MYSDNESSINERLDLFTPFYISNADFQQAS